MVKRYNIVLRGEAEEIWEKLPRGMRSFIVNRLLIESHRRGYLRWLIEGEYGREIEESGKDKDFRDRKISVSTEEKISEKGSADKDKDSEWIDDIERKMIRLRKKINGFNL